MAFSFTSVNERIVPEPHHRAGFSSLELIVNATTTLCCLFIVKLYAVYFVKLEKWNISRRVSVVFGRPPAVVHGRKVVTSVSSLSGRSGIVNETFSNDDGDDGVQLPDDGGMKPALRKEEVITQNSSQPPFLDDDQQEKVNTNGALTTPAGNVEEGLSDGQQQMMAIPIPDTSDVVSSADFSQDINISTDEIEIIDSDDDEIYNL